MGKFAIAKRTEAQPKSSTAKAVASSTPLIHALATKIMSYYTPAEQDANLSADEQTVQDLFNKWPNDDVSKRLAELTEAITGFRPATSLSAVGFPVGSLFKIGNNVFVTVFNNGGYAYGINSKASVYQTIQITNVNLTPYQVTRAEAGTFAKELLATKGSVFLGYMAQNIGGQHITSLLTALGVSEII